MLEQIINNLKQTGWTLTVLEGNWVCAVHESLKRGLLVGDFSELPEDLKPWVANFAAIPQWDVLVFCPEGVNSADLKQHRFSGVQLWYWDLQYGSLFPFPPTNDQRIPHWLKQLASGNAVSLGAKLQAGRSVKPILTYTLLGMNLVYFLLMVLAGLHLFPNPIAGSLDQRVLIAFGAKVNSLIQAGEVWRLLTSTFIHIGIIHLVFNLYALWVLGPITEEIFGHRQYLMIYLFSGFGGSVASYLFTPALSAGASGAIFGLLGALLYCSFKRSYLWKSGLGMNLVIVILVNFGFGLSQPGIDNYAHLGGLLTGTIASVLITPNKT